MITADYFDHPKQQEKSTPKPLNVIDTKNYITNDMPPEQVPLDAATANIISKKSNTLTAAMEELTTIMPMIEESEANER